MRTRYIWAAVALLTATAGAAALTRPGADPSSLQDQITSRMRTALEQTDPAQHQHAGHGVQPTDAAVICGVRVYGYEPAGVDTLPEVKTVYGFHLCGMAEQQRPWDVAVELAGPVILDMSSDPPGIQVVEATEDVKYVDRLRQMFPATYAELALKEALTTEEMADLRDRYEAAAGL